MDYVSREGRRSPFKDQSHIVSRSISFFLADPSTWAEEQLLQIIWEVAGDNVIQVVLRDVWHAPDGRVSHNYDIYYRTGIKVLGPVEVNELTAQMEDRCKAELGCDMRGRSHRKAA